MDPPDLDALAAVVLGPIINYRVLETLFGRPPGDVDEERFIEAWADASLALLAEHGLMDKTPGEGANDMNDRIDNHRGGIRFLLLSLGLPQGLIGVWALFAPRSFYDDFPVGTDGWVNVLGPFDEHLVTDVGALFIGLALLLTIAAVTLAPHDRGGGGAHVARVRRAAHGLASVQPRALRDR